LRCFVVFRKVVERMSLGEVGWTCFCFLENLDIVTQECLCSALPGLEFLEILAPQSIIAVLRTKRW